MSPESRSLQGVVRALFILAAVVCVLSIALSVVADRSKKSLRQEIQSASTMGGLESITDSPDYRQAIAMRRLANMTTVLFVLLLAAAFVSLVIDRRRRRSSHSESST